jgi:L-arabinokinase
MMLTEETRGFFDGSGPIVVARAPGRLDVMGGIADYSGSLVLQGLIAAETRVTVQARPGGLLRAWTVGPEAAGVHTPFFELPLGDLYTEGGLLRPAAAVRALLAARDAVWAGYVLGCIYLLLAEGRLKGVASDEGLVASPSSLATSHFTGANVLVESTVPLGAGVSSSASLEVAAMRAVDALFGVGLDGMTLARLCQQVEHQVVGAPCGIMDQVACALGRAGHLLALRCRPHELEGFVRLPAGTMTVGIDSGVKHSVGASRYTRTRAATFMGRTIIGTMAPAPGHPASPMATARQAPPDDFYLCTITPHEYRTLYRQALPDTMQGADFLARYGDHHDPATVVEPEVEYAVRGCTEHAIYENARVERFGRILTRASRAADLGRRRQHLISAGGLMYDSHHSYGSRAGLGAPETDLLVRLVRRRGHAAGLYGAKITGGGSGGTVAVLADDSDAARAAIAAVVEDYRQETGITPRLITGTSPGAYETEPERINPVASG